MTANTKRELIRISTSGLSDKMAPVLDYFFKHSAKKHCQQVDVSQAQAVIIDIDSIEGRALFKELPDSYRDKPLIALSVRDPQQNGIIHVQKPVNADDLLSAIERVRSLIAADSGQPKHEDKPKKKQPPAKAKAKAKTKAVQNDQPVSQQDLSDIRKIRRRNLEAKLDINLAIIQQSQQELDDTLSTVERTGEHTLRLVVDADSETTEILNPSGPDKQDRILGSAPDIDLDDPYQVQKRSYNPDDYLQGFLFKAIRDSRRKNKPAMLSISEYSIVTLPDDNMALINFSESQLHALSSIPLSERTMTVFFPEDALLEEFRARSKSIKLYSLLWKVAIMASRGRIPVGTNIKAPVHLKQWSSVAKHVQLFQHAEAIARLWQEQPLSLVETIEKLNIPQRNVFTFYSACRAIGIATIEQDGDDDGSNTQLSASKKQNENIMNKFMRKFKQS